MVNRVPPEAASPPALRRHSKLPLSTLGSAVGRTAIVPRNEYLNRRRFLGRSTTVGLAATISQVSGATRAGSSSRALSNPIQRENEKKGTRDWQLTRVRVDRGKYRSPAIEGFCSQQSVAAGESLTFFVSADPGRHFTLDLYRLGYYGGKGGRLMQHIGPLSATAQPTPAAGQNRLRECLWEPSFRLEIPSNWTSGVYLGKLTTVAQGKEPYWQSYVIFVVRDSRPADVLFQCSDNTWQAYNPWPQSDSLYTHPEGAHKPDVAVSFDRPYAKFSMIFDHPLSVGSGEFLLWEFPLCYWLEQHGYDVTYSSNSDILDPSSVTRSKCFVSVGHDEYWDLRQYRSLETAIQEGVNVLWLSANCVYMVSPFTPATTGQPNRVITRVGSYGPLRQEETEAYGHMMGPFKTSGPDERRIVGARTIVPFNGGGDWTCTAPDHWIFDGSGMSKGDSIPGLVGWEFHGEPDPERAGLEVVAEGTVWSGGTKPGHWTSTIFPGPKGNFVFNASTIFWAQGLSSPPGHMLPWSHFSRPHGPDPRVQGITHNLLRRAIGT